MMETTVAHKPAYLQPPYDEALIVKAPWRLKGRGFTLMYKFSKKFIQNCQAIPAEIRESFQGGLGYLMLVDYTQTPVGPYQEILFIPGKVNAGKGKKQVISNIFVSTMKSVISGRANWGIPKDLATFDWQKNKLSIQYQEQSLFKATFEKRWLIFPISTSLLPIQLHQQLDGKDFLVNPKGMGIGRLAKVKSMEINADLFPDIASQKPLMSIYVEPFELTFP